MAGTAKLAQRTVSLTEARGAFSPLVEQIEVIGSVAVTVRGKVKAFIVSPERMRALSAQSRRRARSSARGTLEIVGDLKRGSRRAARELAEAASRSARRLSR